MKEYIIATIVFVCAIALQGSYMATMRNEVPHTNNPSTEGRIEDKSFDAKAVEDFFGSIIT